MKSFNKDIYNRNLRDMRSLDKQEYKNTFYSWILDIANGFSTDQVRVGALDRNDIIQECYLAFEVAWNRCDWDAIHAIRDEDERKAMTWSYIKKSVKLDVRNAINYVKDGIRTYGINGSRLGNSVDDFLSILFHEFHESARSIWEEPVDLWDAEKLARGLDEAMRVFLSDNDRITLELFYGIDCDKQSLKDIAIQMNTNHNAIRIKKMRNLEKLNNEETKRIIRENFS